MINDSTIIKIERQSGFSEDWPEQVIEMKKRLLECKLGFPGVNNDVISLVTFDKLHEGDIFIWDMYLECKARIGDEAPLMLQILGEGKVRIEGIGQGVDSKRDPDRIKYRWMDIIDLPYDSKPCDLVLRVDARPDLITGGPMYYYIYKAPRDQRY